MFNYEPAPERALMHRALMHRALDMMQPTVHVADIVDDCSLTTTDEGINYCIMFN